MTAPDVPEGSAKGNQNVPKSAVERPQELSKLEKEKVLPVILSHGEKIFNLSSMACPCFGKSSKWRSSQLCVERTAGEAALMQYLVLIMKDRFCFQGPSAQMQTSGLQHATDLFLSRNGCQESLFTKAIKRMRKQLTYENLLNGILSNLQSGVLVRAELHVSSHTAGLRKQYALLSSHRESVCP